MGFLAKLERQLKNPAYKELTGIQYPMEVFPEYVAVMDANNKYQNTAAPECSPKKDN